MTRESQLPLLYDPEIQTQEELERRLRIVYMHCFPWHGTDQAEYYDYQSFDDAVKQWAEDEFYIQHLTAKIWLSRK